MEQEEKMNYADEEDETDTGNEKHLSRLSHVAASPTHFALPSPSSTSQIVRNIKSRTNSDFANSKLG